MHIAAIIIEPKALPHLFGENHERMIVNLGGRNTYRFEGGFGNEHIQATKNPDYIEGFWGENIPLISALVGENGTGKTGLLDYMGSQNVNEPMQYCKFIVESDANDQEIMPQEINQTESVFIYYSPLEGLLNDHRSDSTPKKVPDNFYEISENKTTSTVLSSHKNLNIHSVSYTLKSHDTKLICKAIKLLNDHSEAISINIPKNYQIELNEYRDDRNNNFLSKIIENFYQFDSNSISEIIYSRLFDKIVRMLLFNPKTPSNQELSDSIDRINKEFINTDHTIRNNKSESKKNKILCLINSFRFRENNGNIIPSEHEINNLQDAFSSLSDLLISLSNNSSNVPDTNLTIRRTFNLTPQGTIDLIEKYDKFITSLLPYVSNLEEHKTQRIWVHDSIFSIHPSRKLSTGEKYMYLLFGKLIEFHQSVQIQKDKKLIFLLLDEADLGFHPQWKKKYVKLLTEVLPHIFPGKKIQILLTTHDPFTLSDIPKRNVVYLQKRTDSDLVEIKDHTTIGGTFGANISDLLAHSFFLQGGLIGDFAKGKIEEIIQRIQNLDTSNAEEIKALEKLISIIDEPILRYKLKEELAQKRSHIDYQIEILKKRIAELEQKKQQSDDTH